MPDRATCVGACDWPSTALPTVCPRSCVCVRRSTNLFQLLPGMLWEWHCCEAAPRELPQPGGTYGATYGIRWLSLPGDAAIAATSVESSPEPASADGDAQRVRLAFARRNHMAGTADRLAPRHRRAETVAKAPPWLLSAESDFMPPPSPSIPLVGSVGGCARDGASRVAALSPCAMHVAMPRLYSERGGPCEARPLTRRRPRSRLAMWQGARRLSRMGCLAASLGARPLCVRRLPRLRWARAGDAGVGLLARGRHRQGAAFRTGSAHVAHRTGAQRHDR